MSPLGARQTTHSFTLTAINASVPSDNESGNGTLTVGKKNVTAAMIVPDKTYDGATTATSTCTLTGVLAGDVSNVSCAAPTAFSSANASTVAYTLTSTATLSGSASANYTISNNPISTTSKINKANAVIVVTPYSVTYNGAAHTATGTATGAGAENLSSLLVLGGRPTPRPTAIQPTRGRSPATRTTAAPAARSATASPKRAPSSP